MKYIALVITILFCTSSFSQVKPAKKEKFPSYFGLQVRPVLPTRFIGSPESVLTQNEFSTTITQTLGYSFGCIVRAGFTKLLAFETGINFTQRNFDITMEIADSNVYATNNLSFIAYDIPLNCLIYVQLSEQFYMNASMGLLITYKPTSVGVLTTPGGLNTFTHTGVAFRKVGFDLNANFGFEYRTEKSGFFYLGGSARVPFTPVFDMIAQYKYQGYKNTIFGEIDGSFLAIDFKYFFPNIKNKGPQFIEGPIR